MNDYRSPNTSEMIAAYEKAKAAGLKNVRLGNLGVFAKTEADRRLMAKHLESGDI